MQYYRLKMLFKYCKALGIALQEITTSQVKKQVAKTKMNLRNLRNRVQNNNLQ